MQEKLRVNRLLNKALVKFRDLAENNMKEWTVNCFFLVQECPQAVPYRSH